MAFAVLASGRGVAACVAASASCMVVEPVSVTKSAALSFAKGTAGAGASTAAIPVVATGQGATFSIRRDANVSVTVEYD